MVDMISKYASKKLSRCFKHVGFYQNISTTSVDIGFDSFLLDEFAGTTYNVLFAAVFFLDVHGIISLQEQIINGYSLDNPNELNNCSGS